MTPKIMSIGELERQIVCHKEEILKTSDAGKIAHHQKCIEYYEVRLVEQKGKTRLQIAQENLEECENEYARLQTLKQRNTGPKIAETYGELLFWKHTLEEIQQEADN